MSSLISCRLKASGLCFSSCHPSCCSRPRAGDQKAPAASTHAGAHPSPSKDMDTEARVCVCGCVWDEEELGVICKPGAVSSWGCFPLQRICRVARHGAWSHVVNGSGKLILLLSQHHTREMLFDDLASTFAHSLGTSPPSKCGPESSRALVLGSVPGTVCGAWR